jgi:hypothetical protein
MRTATHPDLAPRRASTSYLRAAALCAAGLLVGTLLASRDQPRERVAEDSLVSELAELRRSIHALGHPARQASRVAFSDPAAQTRPHEPVSSAAPIESSLDEQEPLTDAQVATSRRAASLLDTAFAAGRLSHDTMIEIRRIADRLPERPEADELLARMVRGINDGQLVPEPPPSTTH